MVGSPCRVHPISQAYIAYAQAPTKRAGKKAAAALLGGGGGSSNAASGGGKVKKVRQLVPPVWHEPGAQRVQADWSESFTKKKTAGVSDMTLLSIISNEAVNDNLNKRFTCASHSLHV
jgi:myosin-1